MKRHYKSLRYGFIAIATAFLFFIIFQGTAQKYTWTELNDMIYPSAAHAASFLNGKVYSIGGTDKSIHGGQYGESYVQVFNPETNSWGTGNAIQYPRMMLGVAQVNGIIYAIGGGFSGYLSAANEAYDPVTGVWTKKTPKPTAMSCFGTAVVNNKIYTFGGMNDNPYWPTEVYDPATNTWTSLPALSHPVAGMASAAANGKVYSIGGVDQNYNCVDLLQVFDVETKVWQFKKPMPYARFGAVATTIGNKIYVFGGAVFPVNTATKNLQIYDIETNTWTNEEILPIPTQWAAIAATTDNSVYLIAGENKCMMTYADATIYNFLYKFQVNSLGIDNLNANNHCSISVIPNPVNKQAKLTYNTTEDGAVIIEIYNITGAMVDVLTNRFEQRGEHEIFWNTKDLPTGIYFCCLKTGTTKTMEKVIKIN